MKSFNIIVKEIISISENKSLQDLSALEKDLISEKLRKLYDLLTFPEEQLTLKPDPKPSNVNTPSEKTVNPVLIDETIHQSQTDTTEIKTEEILSEVAANDEVSSEEEAQLEPNLFSPSDKEDNQTQKSVAEEISENSQNESVADKIKKSVKIDSLKIAIGINEKFYFINELFDGNLNEYNLSIEELDQIENYNSAIDFINTLAEKNSWPEENEAIEQLLQFIERKLK